MGLDKEKQMKETETFYWKNEKGETEERSISEYRIYLDFGSGNTLTGVEQKQGTESYPKPPTAYRQIPWKVVDQGSTPEKEIISPIAISK